MSNHGLFQQNEEPERSSFQRSTTQMHDFEGYKNSEHKVGDMSFDHIFSQNDFSYTALLQGDFDSLYASKNVGASLQIQDPASNEFGLAFKLQGTDKSLNELTTSQGSQNFTVTGGCSEPHSGTFQIEKYLNKQRNDEEPYTISSRPTTDDDPWSRSLFENIEHDEVFDSRVEPQGHGETQQDNNCHNPTENTSRQERQFEEGT